MMKNKKTGRTGKKTLRKNKGRKTKKHSARRQSGGQTEKAFVESFDGPGWKRNAEETKTIKQKLEQKVAGSNFDIDLLSIKSKFDSLIIDLDDKIEKRKNKPEWMASLDDKTNMEFPNDAAGRAAERRWKCEMVADYDYHEKEGIYKGKLEKLRNTLDTFRYSLYTDMRYYNPHELEKWVVEDKAKEAAKVEIFEDAVEDKAKEAAKVEIFEDAVEDAAEEDAGGEIDYSNPDNL